MVIQIDELKLDLTEVEKLLGEATRPNIKKYLDLEVQRLKKAIIVAEQLQKKKTEHPEASASAPKRFMSELKNYAWDQSDKFVKLFITLDGVEKIENPDSNVVVTFTDRSMELKIFNFTDRDYTFVVNNLLDGIVVEKSYRKVKSDMVAVFLKKSAEGKSWSHLTSTEKQLKEIKDAALKPEDSTDPTDPSAGLMNMMKKLYDSGDPEMKKMIAKTWSESNEKRMRGETPDFQI